jgi:hypothetical protein
MISIKHLFSENVNSIDEISIKDVIRVRTELENEKKFAIQHLEEIELKRRKLNQENQKKNQRKLQVTAKKQQALKGQRISLEKETQKTIQRIRILKGLEEIKENRESLKFKPINQMISKMDLYELAFYIDRACVKDEFDFMKFVSQLEGFLEMDC